MKREYEIKNLIKKIENVLNDKDLDGMVEMTDRGGHWIDALEWVLKKSKEPDKRVL